MQEDTDLLVAPMPGGIETLTQIRSPEAPRTQVETLSLPAGALLESTQEGGADVTLVGKPLMEVSPVVSVDAAGEPVPSSLTVAGDQLRITVEPGGDAAYPILVDPNFRLDEYNWTWGGSGFTGWNGGTSAPGYKALPNAGTYPALDLTSGFTGGANAGTGAEWVYAVPRFNSDKSAYGSYPTSWIEYVTLSGMMYLDDPGSTRYPEIVSGILNSERTSWTEDWVHDGTQGEFTGWSGYITFWGHVNHDAKLFTFSLSTAEYEAQARLREAVAAQATVELRDEDTPIVRSASLASPPSGWVGAGEFPLAYELEDTGLGVEGIKTEVEGSSTAHTYSFGCSGTNQAPCARVVKSTEAARPTVKLNAAEAPTGRDWFEVGAYDPLYGYESGGHDVTPHIAMKPQAVELKVDHTPPAVSLSGPLTEQEAVGTTLAEYPLNIAVSDGEEGAPQSGVASVEVKVDGKKAAMANETPWHPACSTQNCPFNGSWTLKASEYALGPHQVEVVATDAVGLVSRTVQEVELGLEPLRTRITSPRPSYLANGLSKVTFAAMREGKTVAGATFECSLEKAGAGKPETKPCTSPYTLPVPLGDNRYTFNATAKKSGETGTSAGWSFDNAVYPPAPDPSEKLVYPEAGKKTAGDYTLEAEWGAVPETGQGVTGVTFQVELPKWNAEEPVFKTVPAECVLGSTGRPVSWPLPVHSHPGHSSPVYLKVRGCRLFEDAGYPEKEIRFRAVFDGGEKAAGASEPAATEFVYDKNATRVSTDATETVGPASVDLLTGAFTMSRTDVSIPVPGYEANLEFTRTYKSTEDGSLPGYSKVMGGAWQPSSPLESEFEGEAWTRVEEQVIPKKEAVYGYVCWNEEEEVGCVNPEVNCPKSSCEGWIEELAQPEERWIELFDNEGNSIPFAIAGSSYVAPGWARELRLTREGAGFVLAYPNGTRTVFAQDGERDWLPKTISYQASSSSLRMVYVPEGSGLRLEREIAPSQVSCPDNPEHTIGCRSLLFNYQEKFLNPHVLTSITYDGPTGNPALAQTVAEYTYENYPFEGLVHGPGKPFRLTAERDPRLAIPAEQYRYAEEPAADLIYEVVPPGQTGWKFGYSAIEPYMSRLGLTSVSRAGAATTIAYGVPLTTAAGGPYAMAAANVAVWGQTDFPVDATAIFPPTHVPVHSPPTATEYASATIHYMDPDGYQVNTASPPLPGVSRASIATTETDVHGDVVRELDPQNRLYALEASNPAARSAELDSHSVYNAAGTEELESWGPLHKVRLVSGETVEARRHTVTRYDEGEPAPPPGTPWAFLPTKETAGITVPGKEGELEAKTTETRYDWPLRKPEETIVDPGGLNIRTVVKYNAAGQVEETRQPKGAAGGTAGDTRTTYYTASGTGECINPQWAGLPCQVLPAAQASGTNRPKLLVKTFAYDNFDHPAEITESAGGEGEVRKTTTTYDTAGRPESVKVKGGASTTALELPATRTEYSATTGLPLKQYFVCELENCAGFDSQATTTTYNSLGQVEEYEDADGNKAKTTYDAYGRPVTTTDAKGSQTVAYDPTSGLPTKLEVSGVGTFTARYDADGDLVETTMPNGLSRKTTYNAAGEPMSLAYTKTSSCGESCTWFEETLERGAEGDIFADSNSLANDRYTYDKAGRLKESFETPSGGGCTTRAYTYDLDSNRTARTVREPGIGGACATSGGTAQSYEYDPADRLVGSGLVYDRWGRITSLPAAYAGGSTLTTGYFATNMVATQSQGGVTNSFQLDATGRQRQREQTGGVAGTEIFHYDSGSDSPSWTALGSTWSRNVAGFGGELAAIQESGGTTTFKLTDLHGDVVASASFSPTATKLLATYRFDEFGEAESGSPGRFGWLGGKSRRTELPSGVVQMGARSYIPTLGRFLTPDPVRSGSANPYDYADQDPVNAFDLEGTCSSRRKCGASARKATRRILNRASEVRQKLREGREKRSRSTAQRRTTHIGPVSITVPWEKQVLGTLNTIEQTVQGLLGGSCTKNAERFAYAAGAAAGGAWIAGHFGNAPVATGLGFIAAVSGITAGGLFVASEVGIC